MAATMLCFFSYSCDAADITVKINGVRNNRGDILAGMCRHEEFMKRRCQLGVSVPARAGTVRVVFNDVTPGNYAIQAFHDENRDGRLNTDKMGIPIEGYAISNNARGTMGPPDFADAEIVIGDTNGEFDMDLKY
jgi:uncharacterized protein (DUF2141 family)